MAQMYSIKQVKEALGLSYDKTFELVKSGRLRAYFYVGDELVQRDTLDPRMQGLRFRQDDIETFIEESLVK